MTAKRSSLDIYSAFAKSSSVVRRKLEISIAQEWRITLESFPLVRISRVSQCCLQYINGFLEYDLDLIISKNMFIKAASVN